LKRALLLFLGLSTHAFGAGLDRYAQLVPQPRDSAATSRAGVRVTYLGTNGFQFESKGHALLVDPYFSRVNLWRVAFDLQIEPDLARIDQAMKHLAPNPDAILVTHGHFDHLLDVPIVMSKTNARLIATAAAVNLVRRAGVPSGDAVTAGDVRQIGPWKIRILSAAHDRLFGKVPFNGREPPGIRPPQRAADWICGEPLAFLIEIDGQRIFIDSGGTPAILPPADIGPVDLAILGAALPDSRARFPAAVRQLRPRYVFPSHQDNFFRPLSAGFQFGPLTNFPGLLRDYRSQALPGQLILFDYFRPWTLPAAAIPKSQGSNPNQTIKSQR
jgi:L-ascorbate metabolism protein UlaG (beta-lactamase superfamily)